MVTRARSRAAGADQLSFDGDTVAVPDNLNETDLQRRLSDVAVKAATREEDAAWNASPYGNVRTLSPAKRGALGIDLVSSWAQQSGIPVGSRWPHGITLAGHKVQVKMSTRWNDGQYVFQLPVSPEADLVALVGVSPAHMNLWIVTEALAVTHASSVGANKSWLVINADNGEGWTKRYGGTLRHATDVFTAFTTDTYT